MRETCSSFPHMKKETEIFNTAKSHQPCDWTDIIFILLLQSMILYLMGINQQSNQKFKDQFQDGVHKCPQMSF